MGKETLVVEKSNALIAWRKADQAGKQLLENLYGKDLFAHQDVTDRVKTYVDACIDLGRHPHSRDELLKIGFTIKEVIRRELETVAEALNEGTVLDIYNSDVKRWYPVFSCNGSPASFAFYVSNYDLTIAFAGSGSRLPVKTKALSDYFGTQFLDLWREYLEY